MKTDQPKPTKRKFRRKKIKGVKGHATVFHAEGDFIDGDVLYYERVLSKEERKRVEAHLKGKMILK